MRKYDILLFDLDGTLTDSAPGVYNGFCRALRSLGMEPPEFQDFKKCMGPPLTYSFKNFFDLEGERLEAAKRVYLEYAAARGYAENSLIPGVENALRRLRSAGYTLAMASTKAQEQLESVVRRFALGQYFDLLAGSLDDSGRQSKADVIRYIMKALPIPDPSRALMIGDRYFDVDGARECGIETMGVLYGYGSAAELASAGALHLSPTPADVAAYLGA